MHVTRFWVVGAALAGLTVAGLVIVHAQPARRAAQTFVVQSGDAPAVRAMRFLGEGTRIGVVARDLEAAQQAPAGATSGAIVDEVVAEGPAAKAGIKAGDVITVFDGERVRSVRQLSRLVDETPAGRSVKMSVLREGRSVDVSVTPEAAGGRIAVGPGDLAIVGEKLREQAERTGEELKERRFEWRVAPHLPDFEPGGPNVFSWAMRGPRLGVGIQDLTPGLAEYFGVKQGALVTSVTDGSPAAKAGIKAGDVITAVDGNAVEDSGDLRRETWRNEDAKELTLGVVRDKKTLTVKVAVEPPAESLQTKRVIRM